MHQLQETIMKSNDGYESPTIQQSYDINTIKSDKIQDNLDTLYPNEESNNKFVYLNEPENDYYAQTKPMIELFKVEQQVNSEENYFENKNSKSKSIDSSNYVSRVEVNYKQSSNRKYLIIFC